MSEAPPRQWIRLRKGARFVADLWSGFDERQQREILVSALLSRKVLMRARFAAKPRHPDGRPMLPTSERNGVLGGTTPLPNIQVFLQMDPRLVTWDIPAGRVVICPIYDDRRFWGPFDFEGHFPGATTIATGRFLSIELDDIEFDGAAATAYIVENLLPSNATATGERVPHGESRSPASPQADGTVIPYPPYRTGAPGKPSSWHLLNAECRRRYKLSERHPNSQTELESPAEWARVLLNWLAKAHPQAPQLTQKTLTNHLAGLLRELAAAQQPEP